MDRFYKPMATFSLLIFVLQVNSQDRFEPHGAMLRFPDVNQTHIVFLYANDLWQVPRSGGLAQPLASPPGQESFPRYSPDGKTIAFMGHYDGNRDLYTVPAAGGIPHRVTHHPSTEVLDDWTPDGHGLLFHARGMDIYPRATQLFTVAAAGGLPQAMPIPYGARGAISPDGKWLAYTPHTRDGRTWKRYRGGMATDLWLFHLQDNRSQKITDWEGTDTMPMWHGEKLYYLSDGGPNHRLNIWVYDPADNSRRQITQFSDFDVKWPAIGPGGNGQGEIVLQSGSHLHLLDLATEKTQKVSVTIPGARPTLRPQSKQAGNLIFNSNISSTGKRAVVEARGDIWTLPAKNGSPRNLTRTNGEAERDPSWSPDGKWISFFSDKENAYDLYIMGSDGRGEKKKLTELANPFLYQPTWSPDSKKLAFSDKTGAVFIHDIPSGNTLKIDQDPYAAQPSTSWSPDSRWLAYTRTCLNLHNAIVLYDWEKKESHQVTQGMFNDSWPTFDRDGDYLYFTSMRDLGSPIYEDNGTTWIYAETELLYAIPLRRDMKSPLAVKSDEEATEDDDKEEEDKSKKTDQKKGKKKKKKDDSNKDGEKKEEKPKPTKIDLDDFELRAVALPVERGLFSNLGVNHEGHLLYIRNVARGNKGTPSLKILDLKDDKPKEKSVIKQLRSTRYSADGKKVLVSARRKMAIIDAKPDQKWDATINTTDMHVMVEPKTEWRQLYNEAWRIQRDFFYDPTMHGVDWEAVRTQYATMLEDATTRSDVSYVIREMISEINVGHAYYGGGDLERPSSISVGMLGVDFEKENGAYRFSKIFRGGPWDADSRGPLSQPGVDVAVGDYLLAVNGNPVDPQKDPWAAFQNLAGKTVTLTVSKKPSMDAEARDLVVQTERSEANLRYRSWVEKNRAYVAEKTDGKVGYIYVPNTGVNGQNELVRQFHGQKHMSGLIIDERWNGGGQIPTRFIELLNRPVANYWAVRAGNDWMWPPDSHQGPKCMLINGLAGSGGDYFPYWFRETGLGKLIGMRTWGGLVGISGNPSLIDGGTTTAPTFAFYETDGTWGIEGHGVDPDMEVIDDPSKMVGGGDPQLDAAIAHMLEEIKLRPHVKPKRPAYPNRKGMGIPEKDR